jgi:hypothetical protein
LQAQTALADRELTPALQRTGYLARTQSEEEICSLLGGLKEAQKDDLRGRPITSNLNNSPYFLLRHKDYLGETRHVSEELELCSGHRHSLDLLLDPELAGVATLLLAAVDGARVEAGIALSANLLLTPVPVGRECCFEASP